MYQQACTGPQGDQIHQPGGGLHHEDNYCMQLKNFTLK